MSKFEKLSIATLIVASNIAELLQTPITLLGIGIIAIAFTIWEENNESKSAE